MSFRYRYVAFGTRFTRADGRRTEGDHEPSHLYENELALDVGAACWGVAAARPDDANLSVIDHHFHRDSGQFPSAAAAVLHLAPKIAGRFRDVEGDLWLVSHQSPDFDAFCSMYLARRVIEGARQVRGGGTIDNGHVAADGWDACGLEPTGWRVKSAARDGEEKKPRAEIDWFSPSLRGLTPCRRWPLLLATVASCVDNGRRFACPKNRALHSVLYAALTRGRDYLAETNGALEFFHATTEAMTDPTLSLNPMTDSLFENNRIFAPELELLDREVAAYDRDIQRARRVVVFLRESKDGYDDWFPAIQAAALRNPDGSINPPHLLHDHKGTQADGIYIRDPDCLLFKEWARVDREHSSSGAGFLFTAIAYSGGRRGAAPNETDYFFSLDPERAGKRHLYNVWAALQHAEVGALCQPLGPDRAGFEGRALHCEGYLHDPWYDGQNYAATIVATPGSGTALGPPGHAPDLSDDPVVRVVRHLLEHSIFAAAVTVWDVAASPSAAGRQWPPMPVERAVEEIGPPTPDTYRFGWTLVSDDIDTLDPAMAAQVGDILWKLLNPDGGENGAGGVPDGHLIVDAEGIGVWGRRGIIVGPKQRSAARADALKAKFLELATLSRDLKDLLEQSERDFAESRNEARSESEREQIADKRRMKRIEQGEQLTRRVVQFEHGLALSQSRLLRAFFDANRLGEVLAGARELNGVELDRARNARIDENIATVAEVQKTAHWIETFVISVYAVELFDILGAAFRFEPLYIAGCVLAVAFITSIAIATVLHPWSHASGESAETKRNTVRDKVAFLLMIGLLVVLYVVCGYSYFLAPQAEQTKGSGHRPPETKTEGTAPPPAVL